MGSSGPAHATYFYETYDGTSWSESYGYRNLLKYSRCNYVQVQELQTAGLAVWRNSDPRYLPGRIQQHYRRI